MYSSIIEYLNSTHFTVDFIKVFIFFIPQLSKILKDHNFTVDFVKVLVICIPQLLKILKVHILTVDFVKVLIICNPQLLGLLRKAHTITSGNNECPSIVKNKNWSSLACYLISNYLLH